jgi:hypothetical protein
MAYQETTDLVDACRRMEINVPALFLNLATSDSDCPLCAALYRNEEQVRKKYTQTFPEKPRVLVYYMGETRGLQRIEALGEALYNWWFMIVDCWLKEPKNMADFSIDETEHISLCETLDRVLNKGAVIFGEVMISVANVDLIYIALQVMVGSVETVRGEMPTSGSNPPPIRLGIRADNVGKLKIDDWRLAIESGFEFFNQ